MSKLRGVDLKDKREYFADIIMGHKFELVDAGTKAKFFCAFCGGRGKHYYTLRRDDGKEYDVGATCLERVGISLKEVKRKEKIIEREKQVEKAKELLKPAEDLPEMKDLTPSELDDLLDDL